MKKTFSRCSVLCIALLMICTLLLPSLAMAAEEPTTINFYTGKAIYKPGGAIQEALEEALNVKFGLYSEDPDAFKMLLASGEYPDVAKASYTQMIDWASQGLLRTLPLEMIKQYAPNFYRITEGTEMKWAGVTYDNSIYALRSVSSVEPDYWIGAIRQDWLEKIGITELGNEVTIEELENILLKFVLEDPDGNGIDDTHAISQAWEMDRQFYQIAGSFGVLLESGSGRGWIAKDGAVTYSPLLPAYKDCLKLLKKWYDLGIIDPEFLSETAATFNEKFATGKIGYICGGAGNFNPDSASLSSLRPVYEFKKQNPDVKLNFITRVVGAQGEAYSNRANSGGGGLVFFKHVDDEKAAKILAAFDKMNSDMDLHKISIFGIEGDMYSINEKGMVTVNAEQSATIAKLKQEGGITGQTIFFPYYDEERNALLHGPTWLQEYWTMPMPVQLNVPFTPGFPSKDSVNQLSDIYKVATEFTANAILGKVDIDTGWEDMVAQLKKMDVDSFIQEYNEKYLVRPGQ